MEMKVFSKDIPSKLMLKLSEEEKIILADILTFSGIDAKYAHDTYSYLYKMGLKEMYKKINKGRIVVKFIKNKKWAIVPFKDLKKGDVFILFDNGERYVDKVNNNNTWTATSDAYIGDDGFWTVNTYY